ncbi:MAG: hypothetical protein HY064_13280 [Bacteroidetes bacterium]|nr:hypothetical protein [Bacteroidota bacterium]
MKNSHFIPLCALAAALTCLCFASCKPDQKTAGNTRHAVDPALKDDVPFRDFDVDVANDDTVRLGEGTNIYIPKNIFVDANGNPVNGKIQLHYRAFYTPGEIIASGITMVYDTSGTDHTFASAGMFQISGTQNGNPVSIAPGKSISMDFASSKNDADYNFYELDTANAKWGFVSTSTAGPNTLRMKLLAAIDKFFPKPVDPHEYDPSKAILNLDVDVSDHPELSGYSNILWQYAGTGTDPEKNKWIYDEEWTSAKLVMNDSNTCRYNMKLSDNSRTFSTDVYPSLKGENYQKAKEDFKTKMFAFENSERGRQQNRINVALTQQFERKLNINRFGICNFDMWAIYGKVRQIRARFHFDDAEFEKNLENVAVFVCAVGGRFIRTYVGSEIADISYIQERNSCVIAVLRGTSKACILNNNEFIGECPKDRDGIADFHLHKTSKAVTNSKDIDELISQL